jgi:CHRD domain
MTSRWVKTLVLAAAWMGLTAGSAQAQTFTLTAQLTGGNETPAAINTGAFGTATVTVNMNARTVTYRVEVFNLPSGVTASHIHVGAAGTGGPVVVNFAPPVPASNDFEFSGTVKDSEFLLRPDQGIRSPDDMFQAIIGGNAYVNVHSSVNPGGEIRGQLVLKQ